MYTISQKRSFTSFNGSTMKDTQKEVGTARTKEGLEKLMKSLTDSLSRQGFKEETTFTGTRLYLYVNRLGDRTVVRFNIKERI